MQRIIPGLRASKTMMVIAAAALLLALPGVLGAGPDDEKEARAVKIEGTEGAGIPDSNPAANITQWDVFEGHTFAGGPCNARRFPAGGLPGRLRQRVGE